MAVSIDLSLQQQARMLIPISLFFHNDEPDPRSLSKTTLLTYEDTYKSYIGKRDEYLNIHTKAGDVEEAARLEAFFVDSVENPYLTSFFRVRCLSLPVESFSKSLSSPFCKKCRFLRFAQKEWGRIWSIRR